MGCLFSGHAYLPSHPAIPDETHAFPATAYIAMAQPGDLILVKSRGPIYSVGRRLTGNRYDHIAVLLDKQETLNIVRPRAILLSVRTLFKPRNTPLILRPQWRNARQCEDFVLAMRAFSGIAYDVRKTLRGILYSLLHTWFAIRIPMPKSHISSSRWICTEAIIVTLCLTFPEFKAIDSLTLDYNRLGFATTNDFLRIAGQLPDVLQVVIPEQPRHLR